MFRSVGSEENITTAMMSRKFPFLRSAVIHYDITSDTSSNASRPKEKHDIDELDDWINHSQQEDQPSLTEANVQQNESPPVLLPIRERSTSSFDIESNSTVDEATNNVEEPSHMNKKYVFIAFIVGIGTLVLLSNW